ncbi:MAG TPA: hypothetical protein VMX56_02470 [Anaerolineales bacterium]|nr:hypothetical protein [Anaerolineales bacterium]
MGKKQRGDRYHLLLYKNIVGRHARKALLLSFLFLALWFLVDRDYAYRLERSTQPWLFAGGLVTFAYWLFARFGPGLAYAQAHHDHLRLQTPIFRLNISYRRIINTRPVVFGKLFPPEKMPRRDRHPMKPFLGVTALGVDLRGLPLPTWLLRLFLSRYMLANDQIGFVLIIDDWMRFSNQLTSLLGEWRASRQHRPPNAGIGVSDFLSD